MNLKTQNTSIKNTTKAKAKFEIKDETTPAEFVTKLAWDALYILASIIKLKTHSVVDKEIDKIGEEKKLDKDKIEKIKKSNNLKMDVVDLVYSEKQNDLLKSIKNLYANNPKFAKADIVKVKLNDKGKTLVLINQESHTDFIIKKDPIRRNDDKAIWDILYRSKFEWSTMYDAVFNMESILDRTIWFKAKSNAWVVWIKDLELAKLKIDKVSSTDIKLETEVEYNGHKYKVLDI